MWTIIGLIGVLALFVLSRRKAAHDAQSDVSLTQPSTDEMTPPEYQGIMDTTPRPTLTSEQRIERLKVMIWLPQFLEADQLHRYETGALPAMSDKTMLALQIATALFQWRALDLPHPARRIEILDALIRDTLAENGMGAARSTTQHDLVPLGDDEIRSLDYLYRFAMFSGDKPEPEMQQKILNIVGNQHVLTEMAKALELNSARNKALSEKGAAWEREQASSAEADHLIADGWLPFLQSFEGPDINLWHDIATEFDELGGDRLDAIYWIMEQPECDRATAWSFIIGMVSWDILAFEIHADLRNGTGAKRDRFEALLQRWDTGFYRFHSLAADRSVLDGHHGLDLEDLRAAVDHFMDEHELPTMKLPESLDRDLRFPTDDKDRSCDSGLRYSDWEGLRSHC